MLSLPHLVFCTGVLVAGLTNVHGLTDDEKSAVTALVRPFVEECGKEYGISLDEIKAAKAAGNAKDLNPCLISCVLKKIGIFEEKGLFDETKATELANKFLPDEDEKKKALEIIHTCSSVNEQSVTDGELGCERAKLLIECYMPFKGQLPGTP